VEILGRKVSRRCQELILSIYMQLDKPVVYEDNSNFNFNAFGAIISTPSHYVVYASKKLVGMAFETNILHELFHGVQITKKYPEVGSKINDPIIHMFCSSLSSLVLDLEVNDKLASNGFDSSYFFNYRHNVLTDLAKRNFDKAQNNELLQKYLSVDLSLALMTSSKNNYEKLVRLFETAPGDVLKNALIITDFIKANGYNSPEKCFNCFTKILDTLDIWDYFGIHHNGQSITRRNN